ncbi:hypothetical protein WOLCODRAFT_28928 [Wolfiporia cocos MD-104 SS10]|uniref:Uncharacterized protein n=1 Tax=Wolfiporia cocos (strain MD-104) TaxID=742152 RepID=A0A2H3J596_WOLCO|nr:hypothetical protein WOLCODRAFT_28928 [Wolfiporia cocos MD-104 SS10]
MSQNSTGDNFGERWGNKLKGAWNTVEGAGDALRGGAMDFVDSATGTGGHHAETDVGTAKTQAGMAEMRSNGPGTAGTAPLNVNTQQTGTTSTAAAPTAGAVPTTGTAPGAAATGTENRTV